MIKGLKKIIAVGSFMLAGGIYTGGTLENHSKQAEDYNKKLNNFLGKQAELYIASDLEKAVKEERESFIKETKEPFYLTPDLLNAYIKQAYKEIKKWPKEIDKRLFRLMLKQESKYDIHAKNKYSGCLGLGQIGASTCQTLRPEKWESFKDLLTGKIDTLKLEKALFDPVFNLGLSLDYLDYISKFCAKNDKDWKTKTIEEQRKEILSCYNAGHGRIQNVNWNLKSKKLTKETIDYPDIIMEAYHNPDVKVKL
jgi:soluble lytic murein transglycosylase-like protein